MIRKDVGSQIKPEAGHLGQYSTFLADSIFQDHVETADPVGRHHNQAVAVIIDFTDFTFFDGFQSRFIHGMYLFSMYFF